MSDTPATGEELSSPVVSDPTPLNKRLRTLLEWVALTIGSLAIALVVKAYLIQAYYIPSESMEPTLVKGNRVLVNRQSYNFGDIQRGDVIVFSKPPGEVGDIEDLIKRVIGLPGDVVTLADGFVLINDRQLDEPYLAEGVQSTAKVPIPNCANEVQSNALCVVPEDTVFVMGDNRDHSRDSRFFGPIAQNSIVGRSFAKVWPPADISFL